MLSQKRRVIRQGGEVARQHLQRKAVTDGKQAEGLHNPQSFFIQELEPAQVGIQRSEFFGFIIFTLSGQRGRLQQMSVGVIQHQGPHQAQLLPTSPGLLPQLLPVYAAGQRPQLIGVLFHIRPALECKGHTRQLKQPVELQMLGEAAAERLKADHRTQDFLFVHYRLQRFKNTVLADRQPL
ncbi:hypothetical protein D3C75_948340 [compost metagenome]